LKARIGQGPRIWLALSQEARLPHGVRSAEIKPLSCV
jgi:hypothetical protein